MNQRLDENVAQFAGRPLAEAFPYLILDARSEQMREAVSSQAVLIAIGIDWDGRGPSAHGLDPWGQVLAVELANRESRSSWRDFLSGSRRVVCTASNSSSPMITPVSGRHCARLSRKRPISAATCISSGTRSTTCRAGSTATACRKLRWLAACPWAGEAGPGGPPRSRRGPSRSGRLARRMVRQIFPAHRLGRRGHRRNADFLPIAASAMRPAMRERGVGPLSALQGLRHSHIWLGFCHVASMLLDADEGEEH